MSDKVKWLVLCLIAIACSSLVSYKIGYEQGDRACREQLIVMLDGLRMQCWEDLGQAKAQRKEIEETELKKGLPEWVQWDDVKAKLEEVGAYCIEGKIYTKENKRVVFRRKLEWGNPPVNYTDLLAEDQKEIRKLEEEGNYVIVIGSKVPIP